MHLNSISIPAQVYNFYSLLSFTCLVPPEDRCFFDFNAFSKAWVKASVPAPLTWLSGKVLGSATKGSQSAYWKITLEDTLLRNSKYPIPK